MTVTVPLTDGIVEVNLARKTGAIGFVVGAGIGIGTERRKVFVAIVVPGRFCSVDFHFMLQEHLAFD